MSKRFDMDEFVKKLDEKQVPKPTGSAQRADRGTTESTQKQDFTKYRATELKRLSIRLRAEDIERVRIYFKNRDLTLSQGIRSIVKDFIETRGIGD